MDYGRSLVENRLIHATDLHYGQCAELQVVCPACSSPLHKRGSDITRLQYLAHYANPHADCDLRVRRIVLAEMHRDQFTVSVPSGENLLAFLKKFEQIILERRPNIAKQAKQIWDIMYKRQSFKTMMRDCQATIHKQVDDLAMNVMANEELGLSPAEREVGLKAMQFLTSPNTFRAMTFAISFGAIQLYLAKRYPDAVQYPGDPDPELEATAFALVRLTDHGIKQLWSNLHPDRRRRLSGLCLMLMCITVFNFVCAVSERK